MYKYRVTFYSTNSNNLFKTLLVAKDLKDAALKVLDVLQDEGAVFEVEGKSNRHFRPSKYEFIEYELISKEDKLGRLKKIESADFKIIVDSFENNYDLANLLGNADEETKDFFWNAMGDKRKEDILKEIYDLHPIRMDETLMAEEEFIQHILELEKEGTIKKIEPII